MNAQVAQNFLYLNRENQWSGFHWSGLELDQHGTLQLSSLPLLSTALQQGVTALAQPDGPSGLAIGVDGTVYWSDPHTHKIFSIDPCDATTAPVPCFGGEGAEPTRFSRPRGLLVHPLRPVLLVADSGNHRIQLFQLESRQLVDVWGEQGTAPGLFDTPWSLAADTAGNVYVVDYGNQRVQKFDADGNVELGFWQTLQGSAPQLSHPTEIAVTVHHDVTRIYVLDTERNTLEVLAADGQWQRTITLPGNTHAMGLQVVTDAIYIGDNQRQRLLKLTLDGALSGEAAGYEGGVAALALQYHNICAPDTDTGDNANALKQPWLWLHGAAEAAPVKFALTGAYAKHGVLWGGPFPMDIPVDQPLAWHRLQALGEPLGECRHFQFFLYSDDSHGDGGAPPAPDLLTQQFDTAIWRAMPSNAADILVGVDARQLWIGVRFAGDGRHSPLLAQMRADYDHDTYDKHLPSIYSTKADDPETLQRFLSLFESAFVDVEGQINDMRRLFDVATVPPERLDWLAGWLASQLDEQWADDKKRQAIADAFESYAWRGTARGLRRALKFRTGIDVHIDEPLLHAHWWALPATVENNDGNSNSNSEGSILGFNTMLASAEAQGAVLGTTAILDQSHLISQEEYGAPLFEDIAHQFSVQVYRSQLANPNALAALHEVIEQEKPAHTAYHLCIIDARFRVGYQARLGIDTVVAGGPPSASRLGDAATDNTDLVLAGHPPGNVGARGRVGRDTHLSAGAVTAGSHNECLHHPIYSNWEEDHGRN